MAILQRSVARQLHFPLIVLSFYTNEPMVVEDAAMRTTTTVEPQGSRDRMIDGIDEKIIEAIIDPSSEFDVEQKSIEQRINTERVQALLGLFAGILIVVLLALIWP
ncbi:MAG: hypothetical protein BWY68_00201 [bacterium ADurb.Bin400]|nr:MAG: hypothetical protein BWY68_00201 [bacterium ADurb.Bin400]